MLPKGKDRRYSMMNEQAVCFNLLNVVDHFHKVLQLKKKSI